MPIELNRLRGRKKVVWLGASVPDGARIVFTEREYSVDQCTKENILEPAYLSGICAVVLSQDLNSPENILNDLRDNAILLLDFDCNIILRSAPGELANIIRACTELGIPFGGAPIPGNDQNSDPPTPCAQYFSDSASWASIANFISESAPGPAPSPNLEIVVEPVRSRDGMQAVFMLTNSEKLLLQRAFSNCSEVHLSAILKGNSGVDVYRACAEQTGGLHGQWAQPHFVKLGSRAKILDEFINYTGHVDPYVPFHLRPHLVRDRCCLGGKDGILVGDFVEESEDLCDCAPDGRSGPAIACLFDKTLLGWHRRARPEMTSIAQGLLARFPRKINSARMSRARELGATENLRSLRQLFEQCTSVPVLVGPVHGDLHSGNVRVRATDAIVIDFLQHRDFPLVFDAACLEASLLVEGFPNSGSDPHQWMQSLKPLYDFRPLDPTITQPNPKNRSYWFHANVHQIRRYARQWERGPNQYAGALALAMLTKAVKDPSALGDEADRRAGAYVIAEKILLKAFGHARQALEGVPQSPLPSVAL